MSRLATKILASIVVARRGLPVYVLLHGRLKCFRSLLKAPCIGYFILYLDFRYRISVSSLKHNGGLSPKIEFIAKNVLLSHMYTDVLFKEYSSKHFQYL